MTQIIQKFKHEKVTHTVQLQAGTFTRALARRFGVSLNTFSRAWRRYQEMGHSTTKRTGKKGNSPVTGSVFAPL